MLAYSRIADMKKNKAIFLDRDGVINYEKNFILSTQDMELIPDAPYALRKINSSPFLAIVVTNQSAVARNLIQPNELEQIHEKLKADLKKNGAYVDAIYYCPHHPDYNASDANKDLIKECHCRKPKPGLLFDASKEMNIDLQQSYMIGDSERDIQAGKEAGCSTIGVRTGKNIENFTIKPDYTFDTVLGATDHILNTDK